MNWMQLQVCVVDDHDDLEKTKVQGIRREFLVCSEDATATLMTSMLHAGIEY